MKVMSDTEQFLGLEMNDHHGLDRLGVSYLGEELAFPLTLKFVQGVAG